MQSVIRIATMIFVVFGIVSMHAQAQTIPSCPEDIVDTNACIQSGSIYYLNKDDDECELARIKNEQTPTVNQSSMDGDVLPVCLKPEPEEGEKSLIGRRIGLSSSMVSIDLPAPETSPQFRTLTFAARNIGKPWIAFGFTSPEASQRSQQRTSLENVGNNLHVEIPLRVLGKIDRIEIIKTNIPASHGNVILNGRKLGLQLNETEGLDFIEIELKNDFSERAYLKLDLDRGYFLVDRTLAKKSTGLAHLYKLQADETYLRASGVCIGEIQEGACKSYQVADKLYQKAEAIIPDCLSKEEGGNQVEADVCNDEELTKTWELLRSDIAYRRKLLELGLPFYGGFRSLTPTTPHQELIKMEALLTDMSELIKRIDTLRERYSQAGIDAALIEAEKAYALGEYDTSEIDQRIGQLESDFATLDVDSYIGRQDELKREINEFQNELDSLSKQQDALGEQAAALTQAGIAAATGVPISDVNALASGDLKSVAQAFVETQVLAEGAPLGEELLASSEIARGISETVGDVRKTVSQLKELEQKAEVVKNAIEGDRDAIRTLVDQYGSEQTRLFVSKAAELETKIKQAVAMSRSFDRKRAIEFLRGQLTPEQNAEIDRIVAEVKPIEYVFEAAYVGVMQGNFESVLLEEFEKELIKVVQQARPNSTRIAEMRAELKNLIREKPTLLSEPYFVRQILPAIDTIDSGSKDIISTVLAFDPNFITDVPQIREVLDLLHPSERLKVHKAIQDLRPNLSDYVSLNDNEVCISDGRNDRCIDFVEIRRVFKQKYRESVTFPSDLVNRFIERQVDGLTDEGVILFYLAKDGSGGFAGNLRTLFDGNGARLSRAWQRVDFSGQLFQQESVRQSGRVAVAELITAAQMPQVGSTIPNAQPSASSESTSDLAQGGLDPATNMALQAALNSALPGAGIALQLGQAWASMDANRKLQEDYMKRLSSAIREQDQLVRSKQLATRTAALADLHRERAAAVRKAGEQQIAQFEVALTATMDKKKFNRELMSLYRPRFYYIAEALRERFEAFDRSLADWSDGVPQSGFFKQKILDDPRNARLALDSEIQLFGWLNRNIEATRTGPYVLHNHWERLIGLARDYCSDYGCKPGDGSLGQIGQTVPQLFFKDFQGRLAQREFYEWRDASDQADRFVQSFSFAPGQLGLPPNALNARVLDFVIVPVDKNGRSLPGSRVDLRHDGPATLVVKDVGRAGGIPIREIRHVMLPRQMLAPNREMPEDVESLRRRFQDQVDVQSLLRLRDFEGYGLFGNYSLEILAGADIELVDDLRFQISYIYINPGNINSEADFVAKLEDGSCESDTRSEINGDTLTGMFCHSDGLAIYRAAELTENGNIKCSDQVIANIRLRDEEHIDFFRELGEVECLEIIRDPDDPEPNQPNLIVDPSIRIDEDGCSNSEVLLIAAYGLKDVNCFGGTL